MASHDSLFLRLSPAAPADPVGSPKYDGVVRPEPDGSQSAYMIPPYASNHASTIEQLPDGTLAAAWFSGEHEEAPGCAIVFARRPPGANAAWTKAATVSRNPKLSNQNPVLFYDNASRTLHLFHSQQQADKGDVLRMMAGQR